MNYNPHGAKFEGRLTPQQMFDSALFGVREQQSLCKRSGECIYAYRSQSFARHCGIGHCMTPDQLQLVVREGRNSDFGADGVVGMFPDRFPDNDTIKALRFDGDDGVFDSIEVWANELQACHDNADDLDDFEHRMGKFARECGLTYTPVGGEA